MSICDGQCNAWTAACGGIGDVSERETRKNGRHVKKAGVVPWLEYPVVKFSTSVTLSSTLSA